MHIITINAPITYAYAIINTPRRFMLIIILCEITPLANE